MSGALIYIHMFTGSLYGEAVFLGDDCLGSEHNFMLADDLANDFAENNGEDGWYICTKCWERKHNCECEDPDLAWEINPEIDYSIEFYDPEKHGDRFLYVV